MSRCDRCLAFTELKVCPQKPNKEDYSDEDCYLIDLESGVWNCQKAFKELQKKLELSKVIIQDLLNNSEELEKKNAELKANNQFLNNLVREKEQRGLEIQEDLLRENEKLKEGLAVGSIWNKALKEERDKYRNMVFDKDEQLTKAKEIIEELYNIIPASMADYAKEPMEHARKFMTEE